MPKTFKIGDHVRWNSELADARKLREPTNPALLASVCVARVIRSRLLKDSACVVFPSATDLSRSAPQHPLNYFRAFVGLLTRQRSVTNVPFTQTCGPPTIEIMLGQLCLASILVLVLMLSACANRSTSPASHLVLPRSCVTEMQFNQKTVCRSLENGSYSCDGIVLQAACVKNQATVPE